MPIGALVGRADLLRVFSAADGQPAVAHGDTFTAHPLSMVAGVTALEHLDADAIGRLNAAGEWVRDSFRRKLKARNAPFVVLGQGSFVRLHAKRDEPKTPAEMRPSSAERQLLTKLRVKFANDGILFPVERAPALCTAMEAADLQRLIASFDEFLDENSEEWDGQ